jgi:hypothetical protein
MWYSNAKWSLPKWTSKKISAPLQWAIPLYTTVSKGLVSKDPVVEINCIPPQLAPMA